MTALQFGMGAYKRDFAGAPEIQLLNRFIEQMPTNTIEKVGLLARPATSLLTYPSGLVSVFAPDVAGEPIRRCYSKLGLFNGDLFVVSGTRLYRYDAAAGAQISISGIVGLGGFPKFAWDSGPGYQHLFVSDGVELQVYTGGSLAHNGLTGTTAGANVIQIGNIYYGWNSSVDTGNPNGSASAPWLAKPEGDYLQSLANMINFIGTPGTDFSTNLRGASSVVTAAASGGPPATTVEITAISDVDTGTDIPCNIIGGGGGLAWAHSTLIGGGVHSLTFVPIPTGESINALCTLDHYVMASVTGSNKMFFINPGATIVGTLNFFSKESNPDPILDLLTFGDTFIAAGSGSIETWYATGDANAPFAPIEGRTIARGVVENTLVLVQDVPMFVGAEGIVYGMGQGLTRLSNNGIEERIREQLRSAAGVT